MNRQQRRAAVRAGHGSYKDAKTFLREDALAKGAEELLETIGVNRVDAVGRLIGLLFTPDPGGTVFRLCGLGGPTGVVSKETLDEAAKAAVYSAAIVPNNWVKEEKGKEEEDVQEEEAGETEDVGPGTVGSTGPSAEA